MLVDENRVARDALNPDHSGSCGQRVQVQCTQHSVCTGHESPPAFLSPSHTTDVRQLELFFVKWLLIFFDLQVFVSSTERVRLCA